MEFRDKLLGSEMRHITELVNMLSFELVIIQDFMSQEFGARFRRFREKHVLYCEGGSSESCGPVPNVSKRRTQGISRPEQRIVVNSTTSEVASSSASATNTNTQDLAGVNEDHLVNVKSQSGTSDMVLDNEDDHQLIDENYDISDSNFATNEVNDDTPFNEDDVEVESDFDSDDSTVDKTYTEKGYKKSGKPIWNKFDWKRLPDGKRIVKCKKCLKQVSPVAKRLEKHYQRCVLNKSDISDTCTPMSEKKPRKPLSVVWSHFDKSVDSDGCTIVTCKYCGKKCSNHATRLGRHLSMCKKCPDDINV